MPGNDDITVVIPCFNYGRFVGEAVQSALGQEGGPPRIVVVDDGSTEPETLEKLAGLPDAALVVRRDNAGPAVARNTGAERARTPYLLMLDADDRLPADALAALREPLEADPALGFSYGLTELFGDWSGPLRFPDFDGYRLLYRSIVSATSLLRRELFEDVGGFDPEIVGYEDWDFYLGALERGWRGRRVPRTTLCYRRHGGSKVEADRADYRRGYRLIRRKHAALYGRARGLAAESDLGALGRAFYRTYWAHRPLPASLERALYSLVLR